MVRLAFRKLLRAALTMWIVVTFVFVVMRASGDPVYAILSPDTPAAVVESYRSLWGLDRPFGEQYVSYLRRVLTGDLGHSMLDGREVTDLVLERVLRTFLLMGTSLLLALAVGVPAGVLAALRRNGIFDRVLMTVAVSGYALPNFFLGILLILLFSVVLGLLPSGGSSTPAHLIMPALTIGIASAGVFARFARSAMLEVLRQPYIRAASARGLRWQAVVRSHALPNAVIPVVTILGFSGGALIGGAVVTETVFSWHGVGDLLVASVAQRDLAVVQAIVLLIAVSMITANFLVDLAYGWLDPRIRSNAEFGR